MIQIQRLEGFYWVARCEGYARAARAFPYPITQPGVHQQVHRLEEELGVALFERVGKDRVVLTAEGRALHAHVAPFLEGLPAVVASLRGPGLGGTLRIHASGHALRHVLPAWVRRLHQARADIEVALFESSRPALDLLRAGETDLLVDHLPEVPADVETLTLGRARPFLVVPEAHPLARKGAPLRLASLEDMAFIAYSADAQLRALQLAALAKVGLAPRRMHAADSAETILGFVAAGLGYSLLGWLAEQGPRVKGVRARPFERARDIQFPVYAAWKRRGRADPLVTAALEHALPR